MDEELKDLCITRLHALILDVENENSQSPEDTQYRIQTLVCILQNFLDLHGISSALFYLSEAVNTIDKGIFHSDISTNSIPSAPSNGMKGRPKLQIPPEILEYYVECGFNIQEIALLLGISKFTVCRRFSLLHIPISSRFSTMDDVELDRKIEEMNRDFPNVGYRSV